MRYALALLLAILTLSRAAAFDVVVTAKGRLRGGEADALAKIGVRLKEKAPADYETIECDEAEELARAAARALATGGEGLVLRCDVVDLIGEGPSRLARTAALLDDLLDDLEAPQKTSAPDGVRVVRLKGKSGDAYLVWSEKGRRKTKINVGAGLWRVAALAPDAEGRLRRVFRKGPIVRGTASKTPVLITRVETAVPKKDESERFWGVKLHKVELTVAPEAYRVLTQRRREYVEADFVCDGVTLKRVGLRVKGNSSLRGGVDGKWPLKVDFDRFVPSQEFLGLRKLNFSNHFKDPSGLREYLAYDLFRRLGVPAGRTAFAGVYITVRGRSQKRFLGFYTIVEQVDGRFLRRRFGNAEGTLWKPELFGMRGGPLRYAGDDPRRYGAWELKGGEEHPDWPALFDFLRAVSRPRENDSPNVEDMLEVDGYLAFCAANAALANYDSYLGTGHNLYLYYDAPRRRFVFIPWDLNEAFGMFTPRGMRPEQTAGLSAARPFTFGPRPLLERLLADKRRRRRYMTHLAKAVDWLEPKAFRKRVKKAVEVVKAEATRDNGPQWRRGVDELLNYAARRHAALWRELALGGDDD